MLIGKLHGTRVIDEAKQMTVDSPQVTPVIFVPGVMGSRLQLDGTTWDPDAPLKNMLLGWAARDPVDSAKLLDVRGGGTAPTLNEPIPFEERLAAIWKAIDPDKSEGYYGNERGWSGVARSFYYELLVSLEVHFNTFPFVPGAHPVYAFGYDWRKSNADSGSKLAKKIDEVISLHSGASKVVLVTHSMGGLVARHACHAQGGKAGSKVKGVVHVVQPVNGAVQAYRRFAEGVEADRGAFWEASKNAFAGVLGGSSWGYTLLMSGTDGPVQLLPNQVYNGWLTAPDGTPVPAGNIYDYYASGSAQSVVPEMDAELALRLGYRKLGDDEGFWKDSLEKVILSQGLPWGDSDIEKARAKRVKDRWKGYCDKLKVGVKNAKDFHKLVAGTAHPQTFMLYAADRKTEVAYNWTEEPEARLQWKEPGGDGTVPVKSANVLDALVAKTWKGKLPAQLTAHRNTGDQEHSEVFADSAVVDRVKLLVFFLIRLEKPPVEVPADCIVSSIEVNCEHAERKFKMALPAAKDAKAPTNVLEIVAGGAGEPDKVATSVSYSKPRCDKHVAHVLKVSGPGLTKTLDSAKSSLGLAYGEIDLNNTWGSWLWPWSKAPVVYTMAIQACHSPASVVLVRVYPAVEPSISLTFSLKTDDRVGSTMEKARAKGYVETRGRPPQTDWKLEFSAKVKYGHHVAELGAKWEGKIRKLASVNLLVKQSIDKFSKYFYDYTGVTLRPVFPELSLSYEGKFKEIDSAYRVGAEWSIMFKADPLIGLTAAIDILKVMIEALKKIPVLTALAVGLDKLRTLAEEHDQTFEIELSFTGQIGGQAGGKKKAAATKPEFSGSINGKLKVEFAAKASLGGKGAISVALGAELKAGTGLSAKLEVSHNDKGLYLCGKLGLLACKVEYAAWASVKVFWEVKESYEGEYTFWEDFDFLKSPDVYLIKHEQP